MKSLSIYDLPTPELIGLKDLVLKEVTHRQTICEHPVEFRTYKLGSNTGNYDGPDSDSYWLVYTCHYCEKRWWVYGDDPEYQFRVGTKES